MKRNIKASVLRVQQIAHALCEEVLAYNPQLLAWAEVKNFKAIQAFLEENFSKEEKVDWVIRNLFKTDAMQEVLMTVCESSGLDLKLVERLLALMALHRRVTIEALANMFKHSFETPMDLSNFLEKAEEVGLMEREGHIYKVNSLAMFQLNQTQENHLDLLQSNPIMVCPPNHIYKMKNGLHRNGYLKIKTNCFTRRADPHENIPVEWLDRQNHIKYQLNYSWWSLHGKFNPYIPEREAGETDSSYDKKIAQALRTHQKKCFYMELYFRLGIENVYVIKVFDYRGRNYTKSTLFNPQGTDADKAMLCLEPEAITPEGIKWLEISIANCFNGHYQGKSLDKHTYEVRWKWFNETMIPLMGLENKDFYMALNNLAEEAESPCCFFAQAQNYKHIYSSLKHGLTPRCWVMCHFDATASGYQIQSIFAKDMEMARLTNLIGNQRNDVYSEIYAELIKRGLPASYTRNQVKKKCLIPAVYNSINSVRELFVDEEHQKIFHETMNQYPMWQLNRTFPDLWNKSATQYSFVMPDGFNVFHLIRPKKHKGEGRNKDITYVPWVISGIPIELEFIENKPLKYSLELGPNLTHACDGFIAREIARRMDISFKQVRWIGHLMSHPELWTKAEDKRGSRARMEYILKCSKKHQFYSVAILTELTPSNVDLVPQEVVAKLINALPEVEGSVTEIHDSFGVHPNNASALVGQYKTILCELARSRYLCSVVDDLLNYEDGETVDEPVSEKFIDEVMKSVYPLC